ncbi:hypothetical protein HRbin36_00242 [bacterium HR36]|nr:hypothetical protein HRbin36_00242 [bacterium HR36]
MYRRMVLVWLAAMCGTWPTSGQDTLPAAKVPKAASLASNVAKVHATVEVHGTGVVRLPADGVRILATLQLRMPSLKEAVAEDERRATKLEQAWRDLKLGRTQIRLLDQQLQAVRQFDANQAAVDIHDLPVIGYVAWRLYLIEITGLPAEQLHQAAQKVHNVALQEGAIPGVLPAPTPWGQPLVALAQPSTDGAIVPAVGYFLANAEAAYSQALKKAKENALTKITALYGNQAPVRMTIQEINLAAERAPDPYQVYGQPAIIPTPQSGLERQPSRSAEIEVVAVVKVVCEY